MVLFGWLVGLLVFVFGALLWINLDFKHIKIMKG